jgi:hypothetical protein
MASGAQIRTAIGLSLNIWRRKQFGLIKNRPFLATEQIKTGELGAESMMKG